MKLNRTLLTLALCLLGAVSQAQTITDEKAAEIAKKVEDTGEDLGVSKESMTRRLQNRACFYYAELIEPTREVLLVGGEAAAREVINLPRSEEVRKEAELVVKFILANPNKSSSELRRELLNVCLPDGL